MNSDAKAQADDLTAVAEVVDEQLVPAKSTSTSRWFIISLTVLSLMGLLSSAFLWQKLSSMQEHLARQSADAGVHSTEARAIARQAQEMARASVDCTPASLL